MPTSSPGRLNTGNVWSSTPYGSSEGRNPDPLTGEGVSEVSRNLGQNGHPFGKLEMSPCCHPGSSAYSNTALSISMTDGAGARAGSQHDF